MSIQPERVLSGEDPKNDKNESKTIITMLFELIDRLTILERKMENILR